MTRIYTSPQTALNGGTRVLLVGAGHYAAAQRPDSRVPRLSDLVSVGPSVREFAVRLMRDWRTELARPLRSIDLVLSEPQAPQGSLWDACHIEGECPAGQPIDGATIGNFTAALNAALQGARSDDVFILLCCGHGFWKSERCFLLTDLGANPLDPWAQVLQLDGLTLGLGTQPPRTQWLFFDCCADVNQEVLDTLGDVGSPVIRPLPSELSSARTRFGPLSMFGMASASVGTSAYGNRDPGKPSRFCEMLLEALSGSGAISRYQGEWWIHDRGIDEAIKSYAKRTPGLLERQFYQRAAPISTDAPGRIWFRRAPAPRSCVVARSTPPHRMRSARVLVTRTGIEGLVLESPRAGKAMRHLLLPPREMLDVTAEFADGRGQTQSVYTELPLADPEQVVFDV